MSFGGHPHLFYLGLKYLSQDAYRLHGLDGLEVVGVVSEHGIEELDTLIAI